MAKNATDVIPKSSNGTTDVPAAPSAVEEPVAPQTPAPDGDPVVEAVDNGAIKEDRPLENQVREYKRKMEDALAERDRFMGVAQDLVARQPIPEAVVPELPGGDVLGQYGFDQPVMNALDQRMGQAIDQRFAQAQQYQNQVQQADLRNEAVLDAMLKTKENEDLAPYANEVRNGLRGLPPQMKASPQAVDWMLNQIAGQHRVELREAAEAKARTEASKDKEIISGSPTSTTVTVNGEVIDLSPSMRTGVEAAIKSYNSRLSDADQNDPDKRMTLKKWLDADKRVKNNAGAAQSEEL